MGFEDVDETFKIFDSLLRKVVITQTVLLSSHEKITLTLSSSDQWSERPYNVTDVFWTCLIDRGSTYGFT